MRLSPVHSAILAAAGLATIANASDQLILASADAEIAALAGSLAGGSDLSMKFQLQARYQVNVRDDASTTLASPDDDTTIGFVMRRVKGEVNGKVTDNMTGKVKFSADRSTGYFKLQDANVVWAVNDDVDLRIGQFKPHFLAEESNSSSKLQSAERSSANETFNQDYAQGIELSFGGDQWRGWASITDGFDTDNTAFNSSKETDFTIGARGEVRFGDATWKQFSQFTSWRGSAQGVAIGAAAFYHTSGDTNPSAMSTTDTLNCTVDARVVGDGWNAFGAFIWRDMDTGMGSFDDLGAVVQGGVFVSDQTELFGRWDGVFADSDRGATGDDYTQVTFGFNQYLVPESHAAKFTVAASVSFDPTTTSIVNTSDGHNLLADSEDGQFGLIFQFQALF